MGFAGIRQRLSGRPVLRLAVVLALTAALGLLSSLSGCERSDGDALAAPGAHPTTAPLHLTALVWAPDWPQQMHEIAAAFHRTHPDIVVDVQFMIGNSVEENLKPKIATHNLPDLISLNPNAYAADLADQGILAEVGTTRAWNNMLDILKTDWTSRNGKHFGISGGVAATMIYFNRDMFRRAGITSLPANFEQFLAVCAALKKAGFTPMVWPGAFPNLLANGPFSFGFANAVAARYPHDWKRRIADGSLELDDAQAVEIFSKIKLIADKKFLQPDFMQTSYDEAIRMFAHGQAAMTFQGSWSAGQLMPGKELNAGVFMPPWNAPHKQVVPVIGSETGFAVCETANKQAAMKFLEFLYDQGFPIQQNARQNIPPLKQVPGRTINNAQIVDYVRHAMQAPLTVGPYYSFLPTNTIDMLHPLLQDLLLDRKTPQQAALELTRSIRSEARNGNK